MARPMNAHHVVTGYSSKQEGLLMIVEARDSESAFHAVAEILGWIAVRHESEKEQGWFLFDSQERSDGWAKETQEEGGFFPEIRWGVYSVEAARCRVGANLYEATQW